MVQTLIVILAVTAAAAYLGWQVYRFFAPRLIPGKACGGSCCSHREPEPAAATPPAPRTQMITSDSLRARIKARQT
jgi:hypothetical protein